MSDVMYQLLLFGTSALLALEYSRTDMFRTGIWFALACMWLGSSLSKLVF